jgi:hypothetical protein
MKHLGLVGLIVAVGCGGSGPVSESKRVTEISTTEVRELCQYWIDQVGPTREIQCSGGETTTQGLGELSECTEEIGGLVNALSDDCVLEVGDLNDCIEVLAEASDAQICSREDPAACERLESIIESCDPEGGDDSGSDDGSPPPDDGL